MKQRLSRRNNNLSRRNRRSIHKNKSSKKGIIQVNRRSRRRTNNRRNNHSKRKHRKNKSLRKRRSLRKEPLGKLPRKVIQMGGDIERTVLCDQIIQYLPSSLTFIKKNNVYIPDKLKRYKDMVGFQRFKTIVDNNPAYEGSTIIKALYDADLSNIEEFKGRFTGIKRKVVDEITDHIMEFNMVKSFTQSGGAPKGEVDNSYQNVVGNVDWFNICCGYDKYDDIYESTVENTIKNTGLILNNMDEMITNLKEITSKDSHAFKRMVRLRLSYCSFQPINFYIKLCHF